MPRTGRLILPNFPHHVTQRGHNRDAVFVQEADYTCYLDTLREFKAEFGCRVYAYCLMTNHVHLVVDPGDDASSLGRLVKRLAGRQTRRVNALEGRSGTLWEGRYKSSPIDTDGYLLACSRYVELNPVRAGLVAEAEDYRWSSYRAKVGLAPAGWLDPDPCYQALGRTGKQRQRAYAAWVAAGVDPEELDFLRRAARRGQLTGGERFRREIQRRTGLRIGFRGPGRPRKKKE